MQKSGISDKTGKSYINGISVTNSTITVTEATSLNFSIGGPITTTVQGSEEALISFNLDAVKSREALGLGTAALINTGTASGQIHVLDARGKLPESVIGDIALYDKFDIAERDNNAFNMPDKEAAEKVKAFAESKMSVGDSIGGVIECRVTGMMTGIGNPTFEKLDANLAKAIMSIGAVKGFEIGDGFEAAKVTGKYNNDEFVMKDGRVGKLTNHSGGVLGGISDGDEIVFRAAVKPTPSISALQETVNKQGEDIEVSIKGRHDPMIVPRAVVVVEAMTALTLVDLIFDNMTARMDRVKEFYRK